MFHFPVADPDESLLAIEGFNFAFSCHHARGRHIFRIGTKAECPLAVRNSAPRARVY